jgi:hypothetical protein
MLFEDPGHIVEAGRIMRELTDSRSLAQGQSGGCLPAALLVRTDQRDRQGDGAEGLGIVCVERWRRARIH